MPSIRITYLTTAVLPRAIHSKLYLRHSSHRLIMEYRHDEYCDTVNPRNLNSRVILLDRNMVCVKLVHVIQTLLCFKDWSNVSVRQEV